MKNSARLCSLLISLFFAVGGLSAASQSGMQEFSGAIQSVPLDFGRPLFVPTHPRVTTTVSFPSSIGAPDGRGFTEDENKQPGEYLVSWTRGDAYFTLTPLPGAGALNLNVPYQDRIYVFYFYPVERQGSALACLNLLPEVEASKGLVSSRTPRPPAVPRPAAAAPARSLGLVDRMKLLRSVPESGSYGDMAKALGLALALNRRLLPDGTQALPSGVQAWAPSDSLDFGLFGVDILFIARDEKQAAAGFCVRLTNKTSEELLFDVASFSARQGTTYLPQFLSDAPASLDVRESKEAYFVVREPALSRLPLEGDWRVAVDLLKPRLSAGAAAVRDFTKGERPRP